MSDCVNVEIRELLPEYLLGRLVPSEVDRVRSHLTGCEDCTAELATLTMVRRVFSIAPPVDTATIVRALPRPGRRVNSRHFVAWRIAAAISFISLGGVSLVVARSFFRGENAFSQVDSTAGAATVLTGADGTPLVVAQAEPPAISFGGGVGDLATEDLEALIGSIESLEAAPPADPDVPPSMDAERVSPDTSGK
jgi:anti-sigma factor RsiW